MQYVLGNYMKNSPEIILSDEDKDHFRKTEVQFKGAGK